MLESTWPALDIRPWSPTTCGSGTYAYPMPIIVFTPTPTLHLRFYATNVLPKVCLIKINRKLFDNDILFGQRPQGGRGPLISLHMEQPSFTPLDTPIRMSMD
jgi:hypothetical protein